MSQASDSTAATDTASTWQKAKSTFRGKQSSEYFDPCQEAASRSIKCLHRNKGDRTMCTDYFQAYRDCKKEWINERKLAKLSDG